MTNLAGRAKHSPSLHLLALLTRQRLIAKRWQPFRTSMKTLTTILIFVCTCAIGQRAERLDTHPVSVNGENYKGTIFPENYELAIFDNTDKGRFTPTKEDVRIFEKELKRRIKKINQKRPNQGKNYGPVIHNKLRKYTRQYAGFINEKGQRILHISFNWKRTDQVENEVFSLTLDGGSYHWTIRYNLDTGEFFHFMVNGIAGHQNGTNVLYTAWPRA